MSTKTGSVKLEINIVSIDIITPCKSKSHLDLIEGKIQHSSNTKSRVAIIGDGLIARKIYQRFNVDKKVIVETADNDGGGERADTDGDDGRSPMNDEETSYSSL